MLIKQIYSMVVCFVITIVLLITLSITFNAFITLFLPEYTNKEELIKYSTNEQYLKLKSYDKDLYEQLKGLPPNELEEKRISYKNEYIEVTKARAVSTIINCLIWIIVSLIFFIVHWKIYKNTQNNNN
ncbi:hypothetical protein [Rickettsia asembonensis]|uniref:hypothetical protein n=1 Tax=Rickettsia asembonensis TaxID=1068590 RepID=UPI0023F831F0|nr:hypothetical protein [Rickettsia asembonensis]WCR56300.1 MAG: hypothetical protein PG979_000357 [Rickettsia asembonensis]